VPEALEAMQELVTARASAVDELVALKNQLAAAKDTFLREGVSNSV
jgi:hypothetical protein